MATVADLRPGDDARIEVRGWAPNTVVHVKQSTESQMQEGHARLVVRTRRGIDKIMVLPYDHPVEIISEAEDRTPSAPLKCQCFNHLGHRKNLYKTRDDAAKQILRRHLKHGAHAIYECPKGLGFHVTSQVP